MKAEKISERYVNYKTAKLLKEAGFDEKCKSIYDKNKKLKYWEEGSVLTNSEIDSFPNMNHISAPTQAFANSWLRKYNYHVLVLPLPYHKWHVGLVFLGLPNKLDGKLGACFLEDKEFDSYEKAMEYGLRFQLRNMIKAEKLVRKYSASHFAHIKEKLEKEGVDFG
jgi:hypothetical protein